MRYRSMGRNGAVVSVVSIALAPDKARPRPNDWVSYIYAALENGISAFEVAAADEVLMEGLNTAFTAIDRRLLFIGWRLGRATAPGGVRDFSSAGIGAQVSSALIRTGLGHLDAVMVDEPLPGELPPAGMNMLRELKAAGQVRFIGLRGESDQVDQHVAEGGFDILSTPFSLASGWRERNRLRSASASDMAVIGYRAFPKEVQALAEAAKSSKGLFRANRNPLAGAGTYSFLDNTPGWSAEEICLAYALTEPSLATVQVAATSISHLEKLAETPEREMPTSLTAQIEMARFSPSPEAPSKRRA